MQKIQILIFLMLINFNTYTILHSDMGVDDRFFYSFLNDVSFDLKRLYSLECCGYGIERNKGNEIKKLSISLISAKSSNLDNARSLLIKSSKIFLERINEDLELRKGLINYPFLFKNIGLLIVFNDQHPFDNTEPFICSVYLLNGNIIYNAKKAEIDSESYRFKVETFEEAERIIKKGKKSS